MFNKFNNTIAAIGLACFLSACGGGSSGDSDDSTNNTDSTDNSDLSDSNPKTYEELIAFYEGVDFSENADLLDGLWVLVTKKESSSISEDEDYFNSEVQNSVSISVIAVKENAIGDSVEFSECSTEPSGSGFKADVILDSAGDRARLDVFGDTVATVDSLRKISFVGSETSSADAGSESSVGTLVKISDAYKNSIGTVTIDGVSFRSACLSFERIARSVEEIEGGVTTGYEDEVVEIVVDEENFSGQISATLSGTGDYTDNFTVEALVHDPYQLISVDGSDGEAGFLNLVNDGPLEFSGDSTVILFEGGEVNLSFDFSLN